MGIASSAKRSK